MPPLTAPERIKTFLGSAAARWTAAALFLALLAALYLAAMPACYIGRFNDDLRHLLAAQSLLQGHYHQLASPDAAPISNLLPGYPLLLAPALKLGGELAGQFENILFSVLYAGLLLLLFKKNRGPAILAGLHPALAVLAGSLMSEPSYLLFTTAVFLLFERAGETKASCCALLLAGLCVWIRPHGALMLVALVPFTLARARDKKTLVFISCGLLLAAAPFLYNMLTAGTPAAYFSEIPRTEGLWATMAAQLANIASNALYTLKMLPAFVTAAEFGGFENSPLMYPVIALFWWLFAVGAYRVSKEPETGPRARLAYVLGVLLLHLYWVNQSTRYYLIILPFALELCAVGSRNMPRWLKGLLFTPMLAALCYFNVRVINSARAASAPLNKPLATIAWLRANTPQTAVLMTTYKERAYYFTGRKAQGLYYAPNPDTWYETVCGMKINYLWLEPRESIIQTTAKRSAELDRLYSSVLRSAHNPLRAEKVFASAQEGTEVYRLLCPAEFFEASKKMNAALNLSYAGNFSGAVTAMTELQNAGLDKQLLRFNFNYGTTLLLSGDSKAAIGPLEKAARAEPDFAPARANLARAQAGQVPPAN